MSTKNTTNVTAAQPTASHSHAVRHSRQQWQRPARNPDRTRTPPEERDSAKLGRMTTFHHAPTSSSKLSRKSTMAPRGAPVEGAAGSWNPRESNRSERKERKRKQNTDSARRMRELRRKEADQLERAYDANEVRIKELELVADELSRELRRHSTISSAPRSSRIGSAFEVPEERPGWFGAPF